MDDFTRAKLNPRALFDTPDELLARKDFTREQKIEILKSWKHDELEKGVAEEENMMGDSVSMLDEVLAALNTLQAEHEEQPPSKHGG